MSDSTSLETMRYKEYEWPVNPHTYREERILEPEYSKDELGNDVFNGMKPVQLRISGAGAFWGDTAASDFRRLASYFIDEEPGDLVHPLWGTRYCYFTNLKMIQEPKEDYIAYEFTFEQSHANGFLPR